MNNSSELFSLKVENEKLKRRLNVLESTISNIVKTSKSDYTNLSPEDIDYLQLSKELYASKQKAEENEAKFRALIETTSDWIWEINANGDFIYVSP